ncbi:MAG: THUMP domain-containing protein [Candidatus Odinarchaeota archaeon]
MENSYHLKQYNLILIRYGEIWLKSQKVKIRMLKILINNIRMMLKKRNISFHKYQLSKDSSRILFFFKNEDIPDALQVLKNVFGIYSVSPTLRTSNRMENICEKAIEVGKNILTKFDTFAIRVKRSGKHDYTSMDVAKIVGKTILDTFTSLELKVNLTSPKKVIFVEIRDDFSYIFTDIIKSNWGGLPIENQKKVIVMDIGRLSDLISGFLLMKRGCVIYPVLFEITHNKELFNIWKLNWKELAQYVPFLKFSIKKINIVNILKFIEEKIQDKDYFCGICKLIRLEFLSKLIENLGFNADIKIRAITDGVSLNNATFCPDYVDFNSISLNYLFSNYPIFTPIIGLDLDEINELVKKVSFALKEFDYCVFQPKNQKFDSKKLKELYQSLEISDLVEQNIQNIEDIQIF